MRASDALQVAQVYFPVLVPNMAKVLICDKRDFAEGIGGRYSNGARVIKIPEGYSDTPFYEPMMIHELAHAVVDYQGNDDHIAQGHGVSWMKVMLAAGQNEEAERFAGMSPEAAGALAKARSGSTEKTVNKQNAGNGTEVSYNYPKMVKCYGPNATTYSLVNMTETTENGTVTKKVLMKGCLAN
jgi:hypothetical protein